MPIPKPAKKESKSKFISRCMGTDAMQEYDQEQRSAICHQAWEDKDKKPSSNLLEITANIDVFNSRKEVLDGREYVVSPVVMAVEGVMNRLYYPAEELEKFPESWDGRPVTLFHPQDSTGKHVSANSPMQISTTHLGVLYNSRFDPDGSKLRSEVWTDIEKTRSVRPEILEYFEGGREGLEVSTGLWGDITPVKGEFKGKSYDGIMRNIRSDHLALLPGGEGACNWDDGCGLRFNSSQGSFKDFYRLFTQAEALSIDEIMASLGRLLLSLNSSRMDHWVETVLPSKSQVIYWAVPKGNDGIFDFNAGHLYRRDYTVDKNGVASWASEPEEVRRKTQYIPITNEDADCSCAQVSSKQKGVKEMTKEQKVLSLIACKRTRFEEKDKEFLMTLNEEQLELLTPPDNVIVKPEVSPSSAIQVQEKKEELKIQTPEEWLVEQKDMPTHVKEVLADSLLQNQTARSDLITAIKANPNNTFDDARLQSLPTRDLRSMAALAKVEIKPEPEKDPSGLQAMFSHFGMRVSSAEGKEEPKEPEPLITPNLADRFKAKSAQK